MTPDPTAPPPAERSDLCAEIDALMAEPVPFYSTEDVTRGFLTVARIAHRLSGGTLAGSVTQ